MASLKEIREMRGLSRREVAEESGINLRSLQDYEQGHKDISSAKADTLYRLSVTLDCSMEELLPAVSADITDEMDWEKKLERRLAAYQKKLQAAGRYQKYYLMHKNDRVAVLTFDRETGSVHKVEEIIDAKLLPPGAGRGAKELVSWWERRAVPLNQGNIKMLLQKNKIATTQNYLLRNLGLSLSDHYWINPAFYEYLWEEVNLFTNDFSDEVGGFRFRDSISEESKTIELEKRTIFYPSASLQGELHKKWIADGQKRYLIKGNYGNSSQQSINEVIAALLHEKQGEVPYTKYRLCDIHIADDMGIGCVCEDFCSEDVEFIPAYDVVNSVKKRNDMSEYEHFIQICTANGLPEKDVREFMEYQILSDFILSNTDRHLYNFGVLRDSKSLQYVGMAPIFDSGNSLFWNRKKIPEEKALLEIQVNSFRGKETDLLKYIQNPAVLDIGKLPSEEEIMELLRLNDENEKRNAAIVRAYQGKIKLVEKLQRGERII